GAMEDSAPGFVFASGTAAITAFLSLLKSANHVIVSDNVYGGTFRLFDRVLTRYQHAIKEPERSSIDIIGDDHVVTRLQQRQDRVDGGHPGCERKAGAPVFHRRDISLDREARRVLGPRV